MKMSDLLLELAEAMRLLDERLTRVEGLLAMTVITGVGDDGGTSVSPVIERAYSDAEVANG